jgi:hypothetical protein
MYNVRMLVEVQVVQCVCVCVCAWVKLFVDFHVNIDCNKVEKDESKCNVSQ